MPGPIAAKLAHRPRLRSARLWPTEDVRCIAHFACKIFPKVWITLEQRSVVGIIWLLGAGTQAMKPHIILAADIGRATPWHPDLVSTFAYHLAQGQTRGRVYLERAFAPHAQELSCLAAATPAAASAAAAAAVAAHAAAASSNTNENHLMGHSCVRLSALMGFVKHSTTCVVPSSRWASSRAFCDIINLPFPYIMIT